MNRSIGDCIHIIFDVFSIGCNHWAVIMIVCIFKFFPFIRNARIENKGHSLIDQPFHMSMCQFCRITFRFTWNRFDSEFINLTARRWREHNAELQFMEESKPERVIFIHVQDTRETDRSAYGFLFGKRLIAEATFAFVCE